MRTAIRDVAEGADMGLETGSVPGFHAVYTAVLILGRITGK